MADKELLQSLVLEAVEETNEGLPEDQQVAIGDDAPLYGNGGPLDSLGVLDLMMFLQQKLDARLGVTVALAGAETSAGEGNPFRTVGTVVEHLSQIVSEQQSSSTNDS